MAAAYQTGISSSPTNLLQTLVTFLLAQGWTTDSSASEGSGWRVHMHKSSLYVNMRAAMDENLWQYDDDPVTYHDYGDGGYGIGLYLGDGYSGAAGWAEQSGAATRPGDGSTVGCGMNLPSGSVAAFHIFDDGDDNICVVVERAPGIFCHMGFGVAMGPGGQPEDFPYYFGSSSAYLNTHDGALNDDSYGVNLTALPPMSHNNYERTSTGGTVRYVHTAGLVRVDAATWSGRWVSNGTSTADGAGYAGRYMRCALNANPNSLQYGNPGEYPGFQKMLNRAHQSAYAGALILPLPCYALTDPGARWAPIGYVPSIFWCDAVGHGYAAGTIYSVGGIDYLLFPGFAVRKGA